MNNRDKNRQISLNDRLAPGQPKKFSFVERDRNDPRGDEPGLTDFLQDGALSSDISAAELDFLKRLRCGARRPNRLFYYRALQNLRDPLHFRAAEE